VVELCFPFCNSFYIVREYAMTAKDREVRNDIPVVELCFRLLQ
jgi:hypothetical protein